MVTFPHTAEIHLAFIVKFENVKFGEVTGRGTFGTWCVEGKGRLPEEDEDSRICEYSGGCFQLQGDICSQVSVCH